MKQFDLERARAGAELVRRDGGPAELLYYEPRAGKYAIGAFLPDHQKVATFTDKGNYSSDSGTHNFDLFMAPTKHTWWFASWSTHDSVRATTNMYIDRNYVLDLMRCKNGGVLHYIEIEE